MAEVPGFVDAAFLLVVLLAFVLMSRATGANQKMFMGFAAGWILLQIILSLSGFYTDMRARPPRFPLMVLPPLLFVCFCLLSGKGRRFLDGMDIKQATAFHIIRIPIEFILFALFMHKVVPEDMTWSGRNFDILSGISAPIVFYLAFVRRSLGRKVLIGWNILCLILVVNVVIHGILALPTTFQSVGIGQPNVAILHFPYVLLPAFLVPMVILAHVASLRQLLVTKTNIVA